MFCSVPQLNRREHLGGFGDDAVHGAILTGGGHLVQVVNELIQDQAQVDSGPDESSVPRWIVEGAEFEQNHDTAAKLGKEGKGHAEVFGHGQGEKVVQCRFDCPQTRIETLESLKPWAIDGDERLVECHLMDAQFGIIH